VQLVECVPNFSEGRRTDVIASIRGAAEEVAGVTVLDLHSDPVHNRMVLTFVGSPPAVLEAAFKCAARAAQLIDLRRHSGEHPRIGATDVIPFVPIGDTTMAVCVEIATRLGRRLSEELNIPVYLYGEAAQRPERRWLPHVRAGEYEGLRDAIALDPERAPDFGPPRLGPAGATAVGARPFLVAYNVNLATSDLSIARAIAKSVRQSSGGLPGVQARAMATADPAVVQVSTNLLDTTATPLHELFERIRALAERQGVEVDSSEVVGLLPLDVLVATARQYLRADHLSNGTVVEARLLESLTPTSEPTPE
jgi:glutamate formiminotransferase